MHRLLRAAQNVDDFRRLARGVLPKGLFEYVERGCEDDRAIIRNQSALARIALNPRVARDVSKVSQSVSILGQTWRTPVAIAPTGSAAMLWPHGELALCRAAGAAGVPFTLGAGASLAMERAVEEIGDLAWFQMYALEDRTLNRQLLQRAEAAGVSTLMVTVDSPVPPKREYNLRNGFEVPFRITGRNVADVGLHPGWLIRVVARYMLQGGLPRYENVPGSFRDPITGRPTRMTVAASLTWDDIADLRRWWPRALLLKGVQCAEDAKAAADLGVDGVVISNHGGRNLDASPAPIEVLPGIVDAVGARIVVLVDGGIRRGSDVVKALALGAKATLVGRATLFGAAVAGQDGVAAVLDILHREIAQTMALVGAATVSDLKPAFVRGPAP